MPKVFICNDTGLDFTAAARFGELVRVTRGPLNMFRPHLIQREVEEVLNSFDFANDYLLPAGGALAVGFAMAWCALHGEAPERGVIDQLLGDGAVTVKLLLYDSKTREYVARSVDL